MVDSTSVAAEWEQAGEAWGERAVDWAYLAEGLARPVYEAVLAATAVGGGTRLLDMACGAGLAASVAAARGAEVGGIDASEALLRIAQERIPSADFRHGDMAALPWADASFDVVTSFNGIWAGHERALCEARRVIRPRGLVGLAFFGPLDAVEHISVLAALAELMPPHDAATGGALLEISTPGVAEAMLDSAGFSPCARGCVVGVNEWPDEEVAWRAIASMGPSWAAIRHSGEDAVRSAVRSVLPQFRGPHAGYRLRARFDFVVGEAVA